MGHLVCVFTIKERHFLCIACRESAEHLTTITLMRTPMHAHASEDNLKQLVDQLKLFFPCQSFEEMQWLFFASRFLSVSLESSLDQVLLKFSIRPTILLDSLFSQRSLVCGL